MAINVEQVLYDLTKVVHAIASTHSFWHADTPQTAILKNLESIIHDFENPTSVADNTNAAKDTIPNA